MKPILIVATRNAHKVSEICEILNEFDVRDLSEIDDAPEVEETGTTFLANAGLKALAISKLTPNWVLADDSGLEVDALGGDPGVYSARYAGEQGDDAANNAKLLRELEGSLDRVARFRCVIALAKDGELVADFSGKVEGRIAESMEGDGGFGYDPLFVPDGYESSFAALPNSVKNELSHRAGALAGVRDWFETRRE